MLRLRVKEGYFLSEEDFSNVHGSPLLNGLYAPLEDRETTTRRYIALSRDEVDVFGASVGHAISLILLRPEVAALVQEKGLRILWGLFCRL